ncbi:phasin family protein [Thalassobaculum sp. OXR-137]|uniref:phasin family protein n=1 Tax=Thalassobaculum sp. OXR-137 TaxID=3100173 RepID=UPI002AC8AB99|nr:phasin family protein [Thalassobaculum sp. OXR-137]WPZ35430.1 phasin family protein [Thalassobaculum sp. OXR-137]
MTKQPTETSEIEQSVDKSIKAGQEAMEKTSKTVAKAAREAAQANGWTETADKQAATLTALQGPLVEATSQAFGRYVEGMAELNQEMTRFVAQRLRYDAEFGHALAGCGSFVQAAEMQQEWMKKAADDYMAEAKRLGEIGQKLVSDVARTPAA